METKHDYSWGEFYETMVEMKQKGDKIENETILKFFRVVKRLNYAKNLKKIRKIITKITFTEYEQNYINSPCLDGILLSAKSEKPLVTLVEKGDYAETCKYYLSKRIAKRCLYKAIEYRRINIVKILVDHGADVNKQLNHSLGMPLLMAIQKGGLEITKFLTENGARSLDYEKHICRYNNLELAKYFFDRDKSCRILMLISAFKYDRLEIVKFLLKNIESINDDNYDAYPYIVECRHLDILELIWERGIYSFEGIKEDFIQESNFIGIYFLLTKLGDIWSANFQKYAEDLLYVFFNEEDSDGNKTGILDEHGQKLIETLIQKGISFETIAEAMNPMFKCAKALLETKYTLQEKN